MQKFLLSVKAYFALAVVRNVWLLLLLTLKNYDLK